MLQLYQISILLIFQLIFYKIAKKYNIVDKPNERSSHDKRTIVGVGIIFPFAVFIWLVFSGFSYYYFTIGLLLISIVSLIDDIFHINQFTRISSHFIACLLLLKQTDLISSIPIVLFLCVFILIVGWINAYNFMDGINGMSALYSIVLFMTFYLLCFQNEFIDINLIEIMVFSLLIFSLFNLRKKAIAFSGDVGSISLPYIIAFIFLYFIKDNYNFELYIIFFCLWSRFSIDDY